MTKGMDRYDDKEKRKVRRKRNQIAQELTYAKYRQRRVENKKKLNRGFEDIGVDEW